MQQTLLALCAILVFSIYALGRHRADAQVERDALGGEAEMVVMEQARGYVARVLALPYDEGDLAATAVRSDTVGLSGGTTPRNGRVLGPDTGETRTNFATYDDADDWNGYTATVPVTWDTGTTGSTITVNVSVVVRYVNRVDPTAASAVPTLAKEVVVTVTQPSSIAGRPPVTASLRQVLTPAVARR